MASTTVSHALILLVAVSLFPPLLNTALQPRPVTFLWVSPLFFLIWSFLLVLLYLAACYLLDKGIDRRSTHSTALPRLAFLSPYSWSAQTARLQSAHQSGAPRRPPIHPNCPQLSAAFDELIHLAIRDFVLKWHTPLSTGSIAPPHDQLATEFPEAVETTIRNTIDTLLSLAKQIDTPTFVVGKLIPQVTRHLDSYRRAEFDFRGTTDSEAHLSRFGSDQLDLFLANEYQSGRLHPAVGDMSSLHTKSAEQAFLRQTAVRLLKAILPYPDSQSRAVNIVVRELLSCTILFPVVDMISDPDFWNNLLEQKAGAVIHEQILVSKLRDALDKQEPTAAALSRIEFGAATDPAASLHWPAQDSKRPDQRSFDAFLQTIRTTSSLLEARRTRNDIAIQLHKTKANLERSSDSSTTSAAKGKLESYLRRLETAYALADAKVLELGSTKGIQLPHTGIATATGNNPNTNRIKLQYVLLNPSSLSFFMEFMDRRKRSILVQFWLIVESFKTPLEGADLDADPKAEQEQLLRTSRSPSPNPNAVKTLREDLVMFDTVYFSSPSIDVPRKWVDSARNFVRDVDSGAEVTAAQVWCARRDVLKAQRQVLQEMEEQDWPPFKKSDLFLKAVQDLRPDLEQKKPSSASAVVSSPVETSVSDDDAHTSAGGRTPVKSSNIVQHADLFGTEIPLGQGQNDRQVVDLFADRSAGSRSKASSKAGNLDILIGGRTQHAGPDGRTPLFREDPLFDEPDDESQNQSEEQQRKKEGVSSFYQTEKMEEIQSALQDIIDEDIDRSRTGVSTPPTTAILSGSRRVSDQSIDVTSKRTAQQDSEAVSLRPYHESVKVSDNSPAPVPSAMAASADLTQDIAVMTEKLEKLISHAEILDALIRKAELTGARASELRLLVQSSHAVRREARELRWQRDVYEKERADSRIFAGQTKVAITDTMISLDHEGKEYAVYLIEVSLKQSDKQDAQSTTPATPAGSSSTSTAIARGWIIGRRYSEFWSLHQALKDKFAEVRALESEFPGKRLVGLVHAPFVDARKANLEKYLQALVKLPAVCDSEELRLFLAQSSAGSKYLIKKPSAAVLSPLLSDTPLAGFFAGTNNKLSAQGFPGRDLVKTFFKGMTGVAEGLDELIGIGPSMLDMTLQRLTAQVQSKSAASGGAARGGAGTQLLTGIADIDMVSQAMSSSASAAELHEAAGAGTTPLTESICDLFVSLFELKETASSSNWLRRQAIVILLQQMFGSTVERKVRETFTTLLSPSALCKYVVSLQNGLWPNGQLKEPTLPRTAQEKNILRENANRKLSSLIPELASNIVGRENARRGTRRIFSALQNKRLNKHLLYTLLDMTIDELLRHAPPSAQSASAGHDIVSKA